MDIICLQHHCEFFFLRYFIGLVFMVEFFYYFQLTIYPFVALLFCLLTRFDVWNHADVIRVGNRPELIVSTLAACIGIFTSLIGWAGILMNNRSFLAVYTFILWITFVFLVISMEGISQARLWLDLVRMFGWIRRCPMLLLRLRHHLLDDI